MMLKFENAPCVLKGAMAEIQRSESVCNDYVNECCVDALELLLLNLIEFFPFRNRRDAHAFGTMILKFCQSVIDVD